MQKSVSNGSNIVYMVQNKETKSVCMGFRQVVGVVGRTTAVPVNKWSERVGVKSLTVQNFTPLDNTMDYKDAEMAHNNTIGINR
jgi:hypothetical protein